MQTAASCRLSSTKARQAFSLVELMVVTVIVVILAGLVAGVVVKAVEASRTTATLTTMEIIKSGLNKQLQETVDAAKKTPDASPAIMYAKIRQIFPATKNSAHPTNSSDTTPPPYLLGEAKRGCLLTKMPSTLSYPAYSAYEKNIPATLVKEFSDEKDQEKLKSILLRLILDKGPKSKVDVDQLPKGALGKVIIAGAEFDAVLDSWGDPIGVDIEYKNQASGETAKPVITVSSLNAVMKN